MKGLSVCLILLSAGCTFETHVSGVVIDEATGLPVKEVRIKAIRDLNGRQLEFAETRTSTEGHFDLRFTTKNARSDEVPVELSKPGYRTALYICHHEGTNDSLIIRRQ